MTAKASFVSDDPKVATVSSEGVVIPVGNGAATVTAVGRGSIGSCTGLGREHREAMKAGASSTTSEPILTKMGCNSGACHGAAAGKNGFRLSLRGYAPEVDYNVLTRQSLARRVVLSAPAESLFLLKPSGAMEHGGGVKFATGFARIPSDRGMDRGRSSVVQARQITKVVSLKAYPDAARLGPGSTAADSRSGDLLGRPGRGRDSLGQIHKRR